LLPSSFVRRFLDYSIIGKQTEIDTFTNFVNKVIGLSRESYKTVMTCLSAFETALKVLAEDINLAYSILIYCLETLSQNYDGYTPKWDDYDQNQRVKLEECFERIDENIVLRVKNILLNNANLKLTKRFTDFVSKYIDNDFFVSDAIGLQSPIKKSDLQRLLINAYSTRSGYVHSLKPILKQITIQELAKGDVFYWQNQPYLTFAGLARLTHHVIYNFIMQETTVESEDINWRNELPGIITMNLAPQYWVWKYEGFREKHATNKLEGLLSQLFAPERTLSDMRQLLKTYEKIIPSARQLYKIQMLVVYYLYNYFITDEYKINNYIKFIEKYESCFNVCCIENMVAYVITNQEWPWEVKECEKAIIDYMKNKYKKDRLKLPGVVELMLFLTLANVYLKLDLQNKRREWLEKALYDAPGNEKLQNDIKTAIDNFNEFDVYKLMACNEDGQENKVEG